MTPDKNLTPAVRSKAIEVVLAGVLVVAGGVMVVSRNLNDDADLYGERQLDTPESAMLYFCPDDGATLSVTPAKFERMMFLGQVGPREDAPPRSRGSCLQCPECHKRTMIQGVRCPEDGTVYAMMDDHGDPCVCPYCLGITLARGAETHPANSDAG